MAHNLDFTKGSAALYSYQLKPWHGLGNVLDRQPENIAELMQLSGLDYKVIKTTPEYKDGNGIRKATDHCLLYRDDNGACLGIMGDKYVPIQNDEALSFIEDLLASGKVVVETAGAINDGKQTFVTLKLVNPSIIGNGDLIDNYFNILNSHDGSLALTSMISNIRVVCNNTFNASLGSYKSKTSIKHTSNAKSRLKIAMSVLREVEDAAVKFEESASRLASQQWTTKMRRDFFINTFCTPKEVKDLVSGKAMFSTRKVNILENVEQYCFEGQGQAEAGNGTVWQALNAVTGYVSHADTLGYRKERDSETKFMSIMNGADRNKIERASFLALNPDRIIPTPSDMSNIHMN